MCVLRREKQHLDVREVMQREHIANEHKYSQAIRELQAKVTDSCVFCLQIYSEVEQQS